MYFDISSKTPWVLKGLAAAFEKSAKDGGHVKMLGAPAWLRAVSTIAKTKGNAYDPKEAGRRIGEALNAAAPSFLLLNDLHNLADTQEVDLFAKTLEQVTTVIKPGVLVMVGCYASYLAWLTANEPAFASRVNRVIQLASLTDDEARLVLAKKLLAKRIVEELEPTYPFDREAVVELNRASRGNPRRLFELADTVLEKAVALKAYQVDGDFVRATLPARASAAPSHPPAWQETETAESTDDASGAPPDAASAARPARRSFWGR